MSERSTDPDPELEDAADAEPEAEPEAEPDVRERPILVCTYQKCLEGFDNPSLDTLVFLTPRSGQGSLEQAIGRIERLHPDKMPLLVLDVVDGILRDISFARLRYYRTKRFEVQASESTS